MVSAEEAVQQVRVATGAQEKCYATCVRQLQQAAAQLQAVISLKDQVS